MAGRKKNPEKTTATRNNILTKSYELFTAKTIESVAMSEIAKASGINSMTLYRYFPSKPNLVVAVATWKWEQFQEENQKRRPSADFSGMTAAEIFDFYLDSFLEMYRNHRDLLRFNQFFNIYVESEQIEAGEFGPYQGMIGSLREHFHIMYLGAEEDHTLRTDESEEEMFCTSLHLMLAAVTRYAVGLVYQPKYGFDAEKELMKMKRSLQLMYEP